MDYYQTSEMLKALAHPVRLRMVQGLLNRECHVDKIAKAFKLPQSTVSQHLSILKDRGIVQVRKEGAKTCYKVSHAKMAPLLRLLGKI